MQRPTVAELTSESNHFTVLARKIWLKHTDKAPKANFNTIKEDLFDKLEAEAFAPQHLILLEQLQCLERFLWPGYESESSDQHVLLIVLLVNVKRRAKLPLWSTFTKTPDQFSSFFNAVLRLTIDSSLDSRLRRQLLYFLVGAFQSLDTPVVRKECAPLVSISIWHNLHGEAVRQAHIDKNVVSQKSWRGASKRYETADKAEQAKLRFDRSWLYTLVLDMLSRLYDSTSNADKRQENALCCERTLELLCDLLSQLPTRRHVNTLLQDLNLPSAIQLSPLHGDEDSRLLREMTTLLGHYMNFPVDDQTGAQLSLKEHEDRRNYRVVMLQKAALALYPDKLKVLYLSNLASISQHSELEKLLEDLNDEELRQLCINISLRTTYPDHIGLPVDRAYLLHVLQSIVEQRQHIVENMQSSTVLPTEADLFAYNIRCTEEHDDNRPLPLPKLNIQYLSSADFLWRSMVLYRCEAFYEIKHHIQDTVKRLEVHRQNSGKIVFGGFSRMAMPISKPAIIDTLPPRVGRDLPAEVKAEIILDVSGLQPGLRREWDTLRTGDVVFLVAATAEQKNATNGASSLAPESERAGFKLVRCAEVINVLDERGRVLRRNQDQQDQIEGLARPRQRRLLLRIDADAYKTDQTRTGKEDIYESINLIVRRKARENNFKAVLDSIKNLAISNMEIPTWLRDVFLGFGDPYSAIYKRLANRLRRVDLRDTLVDWQHLVQSFPGDIIEPDPNQDSSFGPPYVLDFPDNTAEQAPQPRAAKKRKREVDVDVTAAAPGSKSIRVSTYPQPNTGPYASDVPKTNSIPFTPTQVQAVLSGTQPGLTLIVGPPGTGKTDVVTQIISNIYHDFPTERTLLIAHSNQALNQLFTKIAGLDIDERHLLRLGHGEEELKTEASFSKIGRIDSLLERAGSRLAEVHKLAASIDAPGAHGSSCETAAYFEQVYVAPRWKRYWAEIDGTPDIDKISVAFPFHAFFADAPHPLFPPDASVEKLSEVARGCQKHIDSIFAELADIRPFEILRNQRSKSNYLLLKEARIIAMTSTHAAMRRQEIATLGFQYDNVVVEEAAQITEIESFLPLAMQKSGPGSHELRRVVLVGDHLQNSPVIQNNALVASANLEQSLFLRLVRLGVPHIMLDAQGRARSSLAALYHWRYPRLSNLPVTSTAEEFLTANAGFRHDFQFIDVQAYKGKGESEPTPHFIQNLGEAEYAVALFQYMRLLGYPADRISILTAYAGQRALIRDVLTHRCKNNRLFGMPGWVGTVDKYQGEQNDYIILSLVRTKGPGYLRDLRRLTVALSRARLGLYVLGRREVFENSLELREAFDLLLKRSAVLEVVTSETWPSTRKVDDVVDSVPIEGVEHMGKYIFEMTQAKIAAIKGGADVLPVVTATSGRIEDEEDNEDEEDGDAADNDTVI